MPCHGGHPMLPSIGKMRLYQETAGSGARHRQQQRAVVPAPGRLVDLGDRRRRCSPVCAPGQSQPQPLLLVFRRSNCRNVPTCCTARAFMPRPWSATRSAIWAPSRSSARTPECFDAKSCTHYRPLFHDDRQLFFRERLREGRDLELQIRPSLMAVRRGPSRPWRQPPPPSRPARAAGPARPVFGLEFEDHQIIAERSVEAAGGTLDIAQHGLRFFAWDVAVVGRKSSARPRMPARGVKNSCGRVDCRRAAQFRRA